MVYGYWCLYGVWVWVWVWVCVWVFVMYGYEHENEYEHEHEYVYEYGVWVWCMSMGMSVCISMVYGSCMNMSWVWVWVWVVYGYECMYGYEYSVWVWVCMVLVWCMVVVWVWVWVYDSVSAYVCSSVSVFVYVSVWVSGLVDSFQLPHIPFFPLLSLLTNSFFPQREWAHQIEATVNALTASRSDTFSFSPPSTFYRKQGFLLKQGVRYKAWKSRWFVLSDDTLAYYADDKKGSQQRGTIDMRQEGLRIHVAGDHVAPCMFSIVTEGRVYPLIADSVEGRNDWVQVLRRHINAKRWLVERENGEWWLVERRGVYDGIEATWCRVVGLIDRQCNEYMN